MAYQKISGSAASVSVAANTVVIGPIGLEDTFDVMLGSKTVNAGSTTPTSPKIQIDLLGNGVWRDLASGSVTPSTSANGLVHIGPVTVVAKFLQVVAAGTFAAGDASLELYGSAK
jgi:hypothetical protein